MKENKLEPLKQYLLFCEKNEIKLSFSEIEEIVGNKLPNFAYSKERKTRIWANSLSGNYTYAHIWMDANYIAKCDFERKIVTFTKDEERCSKEHNTKIKNQHKK